MSIRGTQLAGLASKHLNSFNRQLPLVNTITPWVRPADWVALPTIISTDQKFAGLFMVPVDSCFCALSAAGAYTVDWGDGNTINYATGVTAEHQYDYTNVSLGAVTTGGWKQAVIVITPQAGQNLTSINLNLAHSSVSTAGTTLNFVDIAVAGSLLATFTLGAIPQNVIARELAQINIIKSAIVDMVFLFLSCNKLKNIVALDTSAVTNMSSMFSGCSSLQTVPLFNTSSVATMNSMFTSCSSLQTVPLFNTSKVTTTSQMFYSCSSLQTVPLFNTSAVTSMVQMFYSCSSLQTVPLFNTSKVNTTSQMFQYCYSLQTVPLFNTSAVNDISNMFAICYSLQTVPLFNTSAATGIANMFINCYSLQTVPLFNTSAVTNMSSMFAGCASLQTVPLFNLGVCIAVSNMFSGCSTLQAIPLFNLTTATTGNTINMFHNCNSLTKGTTLNLKYSTSYNDCNLSPTALNDIYTNLGTATAQTITVTGNWGTTSDDPTIATAKGWTVTG